MATYILRVRVKHCSKCNRPEGEVEFAVERSRGKLRPRPDCKMCRKAYLKRYYAKNRSFFQNYEDARRVERSKRSVECNRRLRHERLNRLQALKAKTPCADCGQKFSSYVMDFDHRDRSTKLGEIHALVKRGWSWPRIEAEIAKCDIVCANCHRLRTYQGDNNYRSRRWRDARQALDELKRATPCLDCGSFFEPCQMDFDHQGDKVASIADLMKTGQFDAIPAEIEKCQLVCANCHRERTHGDGASRVPVPSRVRTHTTDENVEAA